MRYNAQKKKVGMYYTTPILSFRMKCHLCDNWFVIQTDPKVCAARRPGRTTHAGAREANTLT